MVVGITETERLGELDPQARSPRRSSRALANDSAIRDATVKLILKTGIDAISFRDVGREAGLTHGALYARFEDVEELLVDVWSSVLRGRVVALFDASREAALHPSEASVDALLELVRKGADEDVAAVFVLLTARRFIVLQEEVDEFVHDYLETSKGVTAAVASRALTLFSIVSYKIFTNFTFGINEERIDFLRRVLVEALKTDPEDVLDVPRTNPEVHATPLARNDFRTQLAYHTFSAVGRSGYTRATISRISRRANCSPGAIYKLYSSKDDLVVGSIRAQMQPPAITAMRLSLILNEGTLTQFLYAAASREDLIRKFFTLELLMASAHNATIRNAVEVQFQILNSYDSYVADIPETERRDFQFMIRELVALVIGVSCLTTLTEAVDVDFNQFAEPFRRSLLTWLPSWPEITRQLKEVATTLP